MEPKKSNHQANVVVLGNPRVHSNANTLELFDIAGYQVVTKKGNFNPGDLAIYIQPDSVVPLIPAFDFLEGKQRITVRRFRKEWSEGLLMPIKDFEKEFGDAAWLKEGDDVSDILGITHYVPADDLERTGDGNSPRRKYPKTLRGWFFYLLHKLGFRSKNYNEEIAYHVPNFDVESLKNYKNALRDGENVVITEKIHGSQGKFVFVDGKMYAGSRNFWKAPDSPCVWRRTLAQNPWIENWCRDNEGAILYGEVVPTQKGYRYGCADGEIKFFPFDIRDAEGAYLDKEFVLTNSVPNAVPLLYIGPYSAEVVQGLVDGKSQVKDAQNAREGVVVTVLDPARWERGLGRVQLKLVSNSFLEKDSK